MKKKSRLESGALVPLAVSLRKIDTSIVGFTECFAVSIVADKQKK